MSKKKQQKENKQPSNLSSLIVKIFASSPYSPFNYKQISHALKIEDKASRNLVNKALEGLSKSKVLIKVDNGRYKLNPVHLAEKPTPTGNRYVTGTVDMKQTGKAYIITDQLDEDVFIAPNNTGHALHGDTVKVFLFPQRKNKKTEGEIVEVIKRAKEQIVGVVQVSAKFAFLIPDSTSIPVDLFIPLDDLNGAKNGEKAIAKITEWPAQSKNPFGEIITVLGKPGDNNVEMQSILAEFDFPLSFPKAVEEQANKIPLSIPETEIKKRKDFRDVLTFTIDPADAKDFDDALSIKKLPNNNWEVGVHIADVSYYVSPSTLVDKEAYMRGTSIYLVDRVIPMLPERLSNEVCSLRPNEDKLCFSAVFELDENAQVLNKWFGRTVIRSKRRFNYDEVQAIIEAKKGEYVKEILVLNDLAYKLREHRFNSGSIAFESIEVKFKLDKLARPIGVFVKEQKDSNKLIEDFMLLANRCVAEFVGKPENKQTAKTFVYRIHDEPPAAKLEIFAEFVNKMGYPMRINNRKNIANSFNWLFDKIEGKGEQNMIESLAIRTMAKAFYSTENIGHYGLAFDYYTHFTSPIRRYPDLMVHRLLDRYLQNKPSVDAKEFESYCKHSSDMERKASDAERASIKYKQAEYLQDKIGQIFEGLISGVSKWGIFVEIIENKCEGMISLKRMDDDFYVLDEENYQVIGKRHGVRYKIGDKVKIIVRKVDLSKKQMDFELVQ